MKRNIFFIAFMAFMFSLFAQENGLKVGDKAIDFKLKNIDNKVINLSKYKKDKGIILVFTCNHCPYSVAYEDRIIALHNTFAKQGYPVLAINPNDPTEVPDDSFDKMQERAKEKKFPFRYIFDDTQVTTKAYGATRTPHVYLLKNTKNGYEVAYIGAIDDSAKDEAAISQKYVEAAIAALQKGEKPSPEFTKAIGCSIKWKKANP